MLASSTDDAGTADDARQSDYQQLDDQVPTWLRVKFQLVGRHTPLRRRAMMINGQDGAPGDADATATTDHGCEGVSIVVSDAQSRHDEIDLRELLDGATVRAEREYAAALRQSVAWRQLVDLLPLLAQAQSMLLDAERSRCRELEERRGRAVNVRFACYNLSALDPRPATDAVRQGDQDLLGVLAELVMKQRALLASCDEVARSQALEALAVALRAMRDASSSARVQRAAEWCADGLAHLARDGTLLLNSRFSEILGSLLRFHLHAVFDCPSRATIKAGERQEEVCAPRPNARLLRHPSHPAPLYPSRVRAHSRHSCDRICVPAARRAVSCSRYPLLPSPLATMRSVATSPSAPSRVRSRPRLSRLSRRAMRRGPRRSHTAAEARV